MDPNLFSTGFAQKPKAGFACIALVLVLFMAGQAPVQARTAQATQAIDTAAVAMSQADDLQARQALNSRVFDRVWREVRRSYYDPQLHGVDWNRAYETYRPLALAAGDDTELYRHVNAMLALLEDGHARALSPVMVRRQQAERSRRAVLGVSLVVLQEGIYRVENIREGSPAELAGIRAGWRLDLRNAGWDLDDELVEGHPLALDFLDEDDAVRTVTVIPRFMDPAPRFRADASRAGVLLLRVEAFEPGLGDWMGRQLASVDPETVIVVDLRANPGGRLSEAGAVLSCFLPERMGWAARTSRSGRVTPMRIRPGCGPRRAPVSNRLAVLVDASSRSAAELTPAALQEAGRALVVGEKTPGSVLISLDTSLPGGGRLRLSRADLVTSGGVRLERRGVTPDRVATVKTEERRSGQDPALEAAIAALLTAASTPEPAR